MSEHVTCGPQAAAAEGGMHACMHGRQSETNREARER